MNKITLTAFSRYNLKMQFSHESKVVLQFKGVCKKKANKPSSQNDTYPICLLPRYNSHTCNLNSKLMFNVYNSALYLLPSQEYN